MVRRPLGRTGLLVSPIGFGAFKIGRNEKTKYEQTYPLPSDEESDRLLNEMLDLGINFIDTAPAYGLSEARIGRALSGRRSEYVLATKVGERFENGRSSYDFSSEATRASIEASLKALRADVLDVVFVHATTPDLPVVESGEVLDELQDCKRRGLIRAIGFSGKSVDAARAAMPRVDALMVEYHPNDYSHAEVIEEARRQGVGVVVKKGLAAGSLSPEEAIPMILGTAGVSALVIGGLNIDHMRRNVELAGSANP